jgi:ribose transport system substrate-binding protein
MKPGYKSPPFLAILVILTLLVSVYYNPTQVNGQRAQGDDPFIPKKLLEIADVLGKTVRGKGDPENTPLGIVVNSVAPYWTVAQIGTQRAAGELGVPVIFNAPIRPGDKVAQGNLVKSFISDGYKGVSISVIDPESMKPIIQEGRSKNINFITMDSDAPNSGRLLYVGTNNYSAGFAAGKELIRLLGEKGGRVVGLVGLSTAQNAIDRIQGLKDAIKGTNVKLEEVIADNIDAAKALNNAETALEKYPDLAAFVGIYAFNGPAAGQALRIADKVGSIKIVAFDLQPETIKLLKDGVISTAIVQRPYYMGNLSVYVLYAMSVLGPDETVKLLGPYLVGDKKDVIDTGVDIVTIESLPEYLEYLESIGIKSQ